MSLESKPEREAPIGYFITIATMHIKDGNLAEANKVMQSAILAKRYDDAEIIGQLLDSSRE